MGGGALVDAINLHYLVKENKSVHLSDINYYSKAKSWSAVDLRNFHWHLHHFDFDRLDPRVADININLPDLNYFSDIYNVIGKGLAHIFKLDFPHYVNGSTLDDKFLILNPDCAFSDSEAVTDQRWKVPSTKLITQGCYRCYNLQLVNLYNHTSLTFACNVCNFHEKSIGNLPKYQDKASLHCARHYMFYHNIDFDANWPLYKYNANLAIDRNSVYRYFINKLLLDIDFDFANDEDSDQYRWEYRLSRVYYFNSTDFQEDIYSLKDIDYDHGYAGYFNRNKMNHLVTSKEFRHYHEEECYCEPQPHCHPPDHCGYYDYLSFAVFFQPYFLVNEQSLIFSFCGGGWTTTNDFPDGTGSYWGFYLNTKVQSYHVEYNADLFNYDNYERAGHKAHCYSDFLHLDRQPDYILTNQNEYYYFYRSSVTFNFFNITLLDTVIMNKVNEGLLNQTLNLNHDYILSKNEGYYTFLISFRDYYTDDYYGHERLNTKTIKLTIRIIPDYDFSQGLNAVTINTMGYASNYSSENYSDSYYIVDIYFDKKTAGQFYSFVNEDPSIETEFLYAFDKKINFKNLVSLSWGLKKSIISLYDEYFYECLEKKITHNHDDRYRDKLVSTIYSCWKSNSGHLHFVLNSSWTVLNDTGKDNNPEHFYDKIVQPDQWK